MPGQAASRATRCGSSSDSRSTAYSRSRSLHCERHGFSAPCVSAIASLYALYAIFQRLFLGDSPEGFTALIVAITFFAGIQLLFLGLIGEYLGRVYDEAKGRPHFIVTEVVGTQHDEIRGAESLDRIPYR